MTCAMKFASYSRLAVLKAEWANYQNRPDRFWRSGELKLDRLNLCRCIPTSSGSIDQVSYPPLPETAAYRDHRRRDSISSWRHPNDPHPPTPAGPYS